jgi:O-antigen ligase
MRNLLGVLLVVLTASDVLSLDISLGPGLSLKNALLNALALLLIIRIVLSGKFKVQIPAIVASFAVTFTYAALSIVVAKWVIQYPHYSLVDSIITLKGLIVDQSLLLLTFFYSINSIADGIALLRILLICITVANALTISNVFGLTDIGRMIYGNNDAYEANRVYGFFGHANETGTLIAAMLPAYVAIASYEHGVRRLLWVLGMMLSVVVLIMTGSRGGIVALALGTVWAAIVCRRFVSAKILMARALPYTLIGIPLVVLLGARFGAEFLQRMMSQATSADISDVSSGRTTLWLDAIGRMMETPLSLVSGFGWNVYDSMGFSLIPHNHYIILWFELGLVGLGAFLLIVQRLYVSLTRAVSLADEQTKNFFIAGVFSLSILLVGIFFVQLFRPWLYLWPYFGILLRLSFLARAKLAIAVPPAVR